MPFDQGAPQFGLADAKVKKWSADGTYTGTVIDIMGIQMAQATMQIISAVANGDDRIVAAASRLIGAQLQMRFVGMNTSALEIITGVTAVAGIVTPTAEVMTFDGGERMPYFGTVIKALSEEVGDTWVFLPKCKIMSDFVLFQGEYGTFTTPEVTVQCVQDATFGIASFITNPTDTPITAIPPAEVVVV